MKRKSAVVLLSGGLDSATVLALAAKKHRRVFALTVDYGQTHAREVRSAKLLARHFKAEHLRLKIPMPWKGSALLDRHLHIPHARGQRSIGRGIPVTYVPARNTVLLSLALSWAEVVKAESVYIGANAVDYSGYPDCRPTFLKAMEKVFRLGTKAGVQGRPIRIEAPLLRLTKADIVRLGCRSNVPFELTWSCYVGAKRPCGTCDSCLLRSKGFREAGLKDPALHPPLK